MKKYKKYPGNITSQEWCNRLSLAPEDVVHETFAATTQMVMNEENENCLVSRKHYYSTRLFFRTKRVNNKISLGYIFSIGYLEARTYLQSALPRP